MNFCCVVSVALSENTTVATSTTETDKLASGEIALTSRSQNGVLGVDVATLTSVAAFNCLKQKGYQYAIVRAYRSFGEAHRVLPNAGICRLLCHAHSQVLLTQTPLQLLRTPGQLVCLVLMSTYFHVSNVAIRNPK